MGSNVMDMNNCLWGTLGQNKVPAALGPKKLTGAGQEPPRGGQMGPNVMDINN